MKLNKKLKALVILPVFGAMMLQGCTDGSGGPVFATPTNQIPVITSATAATTPEGTVDAFYTATATDGDNHALTFSIAGFDAAQFEIDGTTGEVVFAATPDFEAPTDADGDNVYAFTLTVTDSEGGSASHFISVTVTDVVDAGQRYVEEIFSTLDEQRDVEFAPGLFMDVFTPADDTVTDRPVMILASGGGFVNENRTRVEGLAVEFAQRGYVAATIDYRVGSGQLSADELTLAGMAATHDMFAAVRYFRADALDANAFWNQR